MNGKYYIEPSPNLLEHSLLQKAVRRGNVELVEKVFNYLINIKGQRKWLRDRLAVIGYEECWPYSITLNFNCTDYELLEQYKAITVRVKNKDCDGLAYLAKRLHQYNFDALIGNKDQQAAINTIKNAIIFPEQYWKWVREHPNYLANRVRIEAADKAWKRPVMKKDKAIMLSAAYLTLKYPIPPVEIIGPSNNNSNFQYWTAIDKHTGIGSDIITEACLKIELVPSRGQFLLFYFAGALCNKIQDVPFFELSKRYKFNVMGFKTLEEAKAKWLELRPLIINMTKLEVEEMIKRIDNIKDDSDQIKFEF